jgi:hypothetical protein
MYIELLPQLTAKNVSYSSYIRHTIQSSSTRPTSQLSVRNTIDLWIHAQHVYYVASFRAVYLTTSTGNFPLLPLRTRTRGPAYVLPALPPSESDLDIDPNSESYDCIDEILSLFRANVLFRNFEIKGPADRMLIYGILFLSECLGKVKPTMTARDAEKVCHSYKLSVKYLMTD